MRNSVMAVFLTAGMAQAEVPRVVTDIAPVQSLVAQVMDELGMPRLLLDPATDDPHHMQMRPSQARELANADLVIWMGQAMTPWLQRVITNLGDDFVSLELLELSDLPLLLESVQGIPLAGHRDEDHNAGRGEVHGQDDGTIDPHAWLDPLNAQRFIAAVAEALAHADPENAAIYHANAGKAQRRLTSLSSEIAAQLIPLRQATLITYHDAYRYFFTRFGLNASGSLLDSDASSPSAARLARTRDVLEQAPSICFFSEPGGSARLIMAVRPASAPPMALLDPIGAFLTPGPELYEELLRNMADTIAGCSTNS